MATLFAVACSKSDDNSGNKNNPNDPNSGGNTQQPVQTIPSNYYVLSPDGKTLMKWFDTEATTIDLQADAILSKVTKISDDVFSECRKLKSITLPNGLTTIGEGVFYGTPITTITIPNSVTSIGRAAFGECEFLKKIEIPNGVTKIEEKTFLYCKSLEEIRIPNSVIANFL